MICSDNIYNMKYEMKCSWFLNEYDEKDDGYKRVWQEVKLLQHIRTSYRKIPMVVKTMLEEKSDSVLTLRTWGKL